MTLIVPAEWEPHQAMWLGFPSHEELWQEDLSPAQAEVAALARALCEVGGEHVKLLVMGDQAQSAASLHLADIKNLEIVAGRFGDIWLRDTGPIFVSQKDEALGVQRAQPIAFNNNGWGGKYILPHDDEVAAQISNHDGFDALSEDFILEGGSLEHDGQGTLLTTRQCVLNPNRNQGWDEATAFAALSRSLGIRKIIWLDDGLLNDHTDGHIDNLARFVAPAVVACPVAFGLDDPNADIYDKTARALSQASDARGQKLQVVRIPSPGRYANAEGDVVPASHMNFLIANEAVIVPIYEPRSGELAVEALQSLFPERKVLGLPSTAILSGGGSFHCISQQLPLIKA
jgi:agmatine deiminase